MIFSRVWYIQYCTLFFPVQPNAYVDILQTQQQASAPVFQVDAVDQVPVFLAAKTWMLLKIATAYTRQTYIRYILNCLSNMRLC